MSESDHHPKFQSNLSQPDKVVSSLVGYRVKGLWQGANLGYQPLAAILYIRVRYPKVIEAGDWGVSSGQLHRLCTAFFVAASHCLLSWPNWRRRARAKKWNPVSHMNCAGSPGLIFA